MAGLMYRNGLVYEVAMASLYGRHYPARYRAIAELIAPHSSVLDLCCGPGVLYRRYLARKDVTYTGVDVNERFVRRVERSGGRGIVSDVGLNRPLPPADCVVMQASLYHFLPDAAPVLSRMLAAARRRVIVTEPVRNVSSSRSPVIARIARALSDAGGGAQAQRFTVETLDALFARFAEQIEQATSIAGGREKLYVLRP